MLKQEPRGVTISPSPPKPVRPQRGSIVNVGSTASLTGLGHAAYTPTKHAILGITKNGAYYYGPHGVRCNSVAPGGTVTPLGIDAMPEGIKELVRENDPAVGKGTPMGKLAWPEVSSRTSKCVDAMADTRFSLRKWRMLSASC